MDSSYVANGKRYIGAVVVKQTETLWYSALSLNISAQGVEIIALTRALQLAKGKTVNVYTDSHYALD